MKRKTSKKQKSESHYLPIFIISLFLTIVIHWIVFSRINMHPTIHVVIALLVFWAIMGSISIAAERKRKQ